MLQMIPGASIAIVGKIISKVGNIGRFKSGKVR